MATRPTPSRATARARNADVGPHHRVSVDSLHAHRFAVELTVSAPAADQVLSLPVWIPGSYLVREFARHVQNVTASQKGRDCAVTSINKHSWQVACEAGQPLTVRWLVYAYDNSVRAAWLDADRGFFNGTGLLMRVLGQEDRPHTLELLKADFPAGWRVATGLPPLKVTADGFGRYRAADYDELVDCPVEMGRFWQGNFVAGGVPHRFVVAGAPPSFDGERLLADSQKIAEAAIHLWHGSDKKSKKAKTPHSNYLFMLNAVHDGYGGLEHRNSTALICRRADLPRVGQTAASDGYTTLLGLISHEYFHTWNVKRLRPAEFARYDYTQENYTELLWFFEGFTSYYDDLLLARAGLVDEAGYLKLLDKTVNQVLQSPGRAVQSVAAASRDAWIKYYRPDENTFNASVSYYSKGALVALCLDLTLRGESQGKTVPVTLDDVMRALWQRTQGGPMSEADLLAVLQELGGRSFARDIAAWVHGTGELPLAPLLAAHGVTLNAVKAHPSVHLGLRIDDKPGAIHVKAVLRGSPAEQAGIAAGDEWLAVEVPAPKTPRGQAKRATNTLAGGTWRLHSLDDLTWLLGEQRGAVELTAIISRDRRLLALPMTLPAETTSARLGVSDLDAARRWLRGAHA